MLNNVSVVSASYLIVIRKGLSGLLKAMINLNHLSSSLPGDIFSFEAEEFYPVIE